MHPKACLSYGWCLMAFAMSKHVSFTLIVDESKIHLALSPFFVHN